MSARREQQAGSSSTGLRSNTKAITGAAAAARRDEALRANSGGGGGLSALSGCFGCCGRKQASAADDMSDMPSPLTLGGHIHDPLDRPKANSTGQVRERNTRSRAAVRILVYSTQLLLSRARRVVSFLCLSIVLVFFLLSSLSAAQCGAGKERKLFNHTGFIATPD